MFQFLIGTVKTMAGYNFKKFFKEFQFLIGTVKTFHFCWHDPTKFIVSIPHRYCKNLNENIPKKMKDKVSIPHRYCKN